MPHPFADKLFVFIATPVRCSRQSARDALTAVGGVVDDRMGVFTHYAVAFSGAEKTKVYEKATKYDKLGSIVLLNEEQFFDILEGRAALPKKKKPPILDGIIISEARDPKADEEAFERVRKDFIENKRLLSMARHGVPAPDGGRIKADLRPLNNITRMERFLEGKAKVEQFRSKIAVTFETLESKPIHEKAIIKGLATFNTGGVI